MVDVYVHTLGGAKLMGEMSEAQALKLVEGWQVKHLEHDCVALAFRDADMIQCSFVKYDNIAFIQYRLPAEPTHRYYGKEVGLEG